MTSDNKKLMKIYFVGHVQKCYRLRTVSMTIREIKVNIAILWQYITQADTENKIKVYIYNNIITIII